MGRAEEPEPEYLIKMVGAAGFEPATLWSQTRCASQAALCPDEGHLKQNRG